MDRDENSADAATATYLICILLHPFGVALTFCRGGCGQIFARPRPGALLKIDERRTRQSGFLGSSVHAAYDTVSSRAAVGPAVRRIRTRTYV